jgi:cytochrome c553
MCLWAALRTARYAFPLSAAVVLGLTTGRAAPDLELGRYLAAECLVCHRAATAGSAIPNIFGRPQQELTQVMRAYREKQLPNPVMQTITGRLKDDEIEALAAYFATTPKP